MELKQPAHPRYSLEITRYRTFHSWPKGLSQKPVQMAGAGLFYTGQGDKVRCFYCDGGLKDWQSEDEPWSEHARYFPDCSYVLLIKGEKYVKSIVKQKALKEVNTEQANCKNDEIIKQTESLSLSTSHYKNMICKICLLEELNISFIPCGHTVSCGNCIFSLKNKCPICREMFFKVLKLYF